MKNRIFLGCNLVYYVTLILALIQPFFRQGFLMTRDLVSTPHPQITLNTLGINGTAPRAVPQDWLVAILSRLIGGNYTMKILVLVCVIFIVIAADYLVRVVFKENNFLFRIIGVTAAIINPFISERLLQGHWSLLFSYSGVIFLVAKLIKIFNTNFSPNKSDWIEIVFYFALAALTPTGAIFMILVWGIYSLVFADFRRNKFFLRGIFIFFILSSPWIFASFFTDYLENNSNVNVFRANQENVLGVGGAVLSLGGIWNREVVSNFNRSDLAVIPKLIFIFAIFVGIWFLREVLDKKIWSLLIYKLIGVTTLIVFLASNFGNLFFGKLITIIPGLGILRDSQKLIILIAPLYILALAALANKLTHIILPSVATILVGVIILFNIPDFFIMLNKNIFHYNYANSWEKIRIILIENKSKLPGDLTVFPTGITRNTAGHNILDPTARILPITVVQFQYLTVDNRVILGESKRAKLVNNLLLDSQSDIYKLANNGIRWILVEKTFTKTELSKKLTTNLVVKYEDAELLLYQVPINIKVDNYIKVKTEYLYIAIFLHIIWFSILVISGGTIILIILKNFFSLIH